MKQSAGLLIYRVESGQVAVLLVHPGGPFWVKKDKGAWSIPKGEFEEGEDPLHAAKRETQEELGIEPPVKDAQDLGSVKTSSKIVYAWAVEGVMDVAKISSNTFTMEWPPKSGKQQEFPEVDRAEWFGLPDAVQKVNKNQVAFMERLVLLLKPDFPDVSLDAGVTGLTLPQQGALF